MRQVVVSRVGELRPAPALRLLRRHWLAATLLLSGLILRVLALAAYHPALLYTDSLKYLYGAWPGADPLGYRWILNVILAFGDLGTVAFIQHIVGLAMAAAIYVWLQRRGVARWLAAVAMAPVLLDAYQIQIEQTIMPDVWFEAFTVAGLVMLAWHPVPPVPAIVGSGLLLGASATIRQVGEILLVPALIYVAAAVASGRWSARTPASQSEPHESPIAGANRPTDGTFMGLRSRRDGPRPARGGSRRGGRSAPADWQAAFQACVLLLVAFVVPIVAYNAVSYAQSGSFRLSDQGSIAGRLAATVDCASLQVPPAERQLCPTKRQQANGADWLSHSRHSPLKHFSVPAGVTRNQVISAFDSAVEQQQPLRVIAAVARDSVRLFAPARYQVPGTTPISRWRFQTSYPRFLPEVNVGPGNVIIVGVQVKTTKPFSFRRLSPAYGGPAQVDRPLAAFLRAYQLHGGYTPGPLLAAFALAGLAGSALALVGRRSRARRRSRAGGRPWARRRSWAARRHGKDHQALDEQGRQLCLACLLWFAAAVGVLGVSDVFEFSWRYQLPALVTLPTAGVLAIWALRHAAAARPELARQRPDSARRHAESARRPSNGGQVSCFMKPGGCRRVRSRGFAPKFCGK